MSNKLLERIKKSQPEQEPIGSIDTATPLQERAAVRAARQPLMAAEKAVREAEARAAALRDIIALRADPLAVVDARDELAQLTEKEFPRLWATAQSARAHFESVVQAERAAMQAAFQSQIDEAGRAYWRALAEFRREHHEPLERLEALASVKAESSTLRRASLYELDSANFAFRRDIAQGNRPDGTV